MILDEIVQNKVKELAEIKKRLPLREIKHIAANQAKPVDFAAALKGSGVRIIAEVKKASPSRGVIREVFNPVEIAKIYAENHVAAISVLTESRYFQGNLDSLSFIRAAVGSRVPLLRKDFIFDDYQVYESRAAGADAILLIAAILQPMQLQALLQISHELGMSCLVETHNEAEIEMALRCNAVIIGINNRDLSTFNVDINTTVKLRPLIPDSCVRVSESGIKSRDDIEMLRRCGIDAVLIGERLMAAPDIAKALRELQ